MGILWIVGVVLLVGAVVSIMRPNKDLGTGRRQSAADALELRYARGEIDDEEFHRRRQILDGGSPTAN